MKKVLACLILCCVVIGCTEAQWAKVEQGAQVTQEGAAKAGEIAIVTSPFTGPYGPLAGAVSTGIAAIAGGVLAFAKSRKAKAIARAAVKAAEKVEKGAGGGAALVEAAQKEGVSTAIEEAHEKAIKDGLI